MSDTTEPAIEVGEPSAEAWQALADATAAAIQADEPTSNDTTEEPTPDQPDEDENPNSREARYRIQLRETEAERDQLRGTVEALQRAEVERIAGRSIQKPAALWSADVNLSELLDNAGAVDPMKVDAAVKAATQTLGLAAKRPGGYVGAEGRYVEVPREGRGNAWEAAFKSK